MTQTLLKEAQTRTPAPQSPKRRWVRFAAPVAAAAILIAIAAAVVASRSGDVTERVEDPAADVHPADRHLLNQAARLQTQQTPVDASDRRLLNQAAMIRTRRASNHGSDTHLLNQAQRLDARDVDAERFAGRYSQPAPQIDGSDRHLLNQAQKVE